MLRSSTVWAEFEFYINRINRWCWVHPSFIPPHHHHLATSARSQPRSSRPPGAPPLSWGMWAHRHHVQWRKPRREMRNHRGDPWNGRPSRCVTRTSHDFCRGSVLPFLIPHHRWPGELTRRQANPRDGGPIHETPGQSTRRRANQQHYEPIHDTAGQSTTHRATRANRRNGRPIQG